MIEASEILFDKKITIRYNDTEHPGCLFFIIFFTVFCLHDGAKNSIMIRASCTVSVFGNRTG